MDIKSCRLIEIKLTQNDCLVLKNAINKALKHNCTYSFNELSALKKIENSINIL